MLTKSGNSRKSGGPNWKGLKDSGKIPSAPVSDGLSNQGTETIQNEGEKVSSVHLARAKFSQNQVVPHAFSYSMGSSKVDVSKLVNDIRTRNSLKQHSPSAALSNGHTHENNGSPNQASIFEKNLMKM